MKKKETLLKIAKAGVYSASNIKHKQNLNNAVNAIKKYDKYRGSLSFMDSFKSLIGLKKYIPQ